MASEDTASIVGQVKTVLITEGKGVITSIHTRVKNEDALNRVGFSGDVIVESVILAYIRGTILNMIDDIGSTLGVEKYSYDITIKNIGATSLHDLGLSISGHSFDLPVFLSILSACLSLPIRQDTVFTGQITTNQGHLSPVSGIPEKLEAAVRDKSFINFVYPGFESDKSAEMLAPEEHKKIQLAFDNYKNKIKILPVQNIYEVIKLAYDTKDICVASLESGFFAIAKPVKKVGNPIEQTISYLLENNQSRFWNSLERQMLKANFDVAKEILYSFVQYHFKTFAYPRGFGQKLLILLTSLPPTIRKKTGLYPLIEMKYCIQLAQHAGESDYEDVRILYRASFEEKLRYLGTGEDCKHITEDKPDFLLQLLLGELSPENISHEVLMPIDNARASYIIEKISVESYEEFLDTITAFYVHILRYNGKLSGAVDDNLIAPHALDLLKRSFSDEGEEKGAYSEAKSCTKGGLRYIFDCMTHCLKMEERDKYVRMVLKTTIDPLDFKAKTDLIKALMTQLGSALPEEIRTQPPERFATNYEIITR